MNYKERLLRRQTETGRPIRVGLVGAGQMGRGYIAQVHRLAGMEVVAVADIVPERAEEAYRAVGIEDVVSRGNHEQLTRAVEDGRHVSLGDAAELVALPVDIVVEATGVPDAGARTAMQALLSGRDVGVLNVETDVTVGLLLATVARAAGRVYTVCRGDEPVEACRLVNFSHDLGFEVVCAGKGKNNPLDPHATPAQLQAEAASKHMNPKMLTSFVEGSKTMVEMVALANATGLEISRRGMHGTWTTVQDLAKTFGLERDGGVLDRTGVVDYATGPVAPGVFTVVRTDEPTVVEELDYLLLGKGPYYAFYRPYHLASIEAPLSVAAAVLDRQADLAPSGWTAEVVATAKRRLRPGEHLDHIGGWTVYGVAENAPVAAAQRLLPLGLVDGATVVRDVPMDAPLTYDDVELEATSAVVQMRALQDQLSLAEVARAAPSPGSLPPAAVSRLAATTQG